MKLKNNYRHLKFIAFILLLSLFVSIPLLSTASQKEKETQRILVVNSYHPGYSWSDDIMSGIRDVFATQKNVELIIEHLDTKRHINKPYLKQIKELFRHKYRSINIDIIITSDDNALDFTLGIRKELFPNIPLIFCGIDHIKPERIAGQVQIYGIEEADSTSSTIDLILSIHPDLETIAFIADDTSTGKLMVDKTKLIEPVYQKINFSYLANMTTESLQSTLRQTSNNTVFFYLSFIRDKNGKIFSIENSMKLIAESASSPVYCSWGFKPGTGVLGGNILSGYKQGELSAIVAKRLLDSNSIESIPVIQQAPLIHKFDYQAMKRFNIEDSRLPQNSIIYNKPNSFYTNHKKLIWSTIFIVLCLLLFNMILFLNIRRRKKAEAELQKTHDQLELKVEERTKELQEELNERKQVEKALKNTSHILDERIKELNCLYGISSLIEKPKTTLKEILQGAVDLIPPSWQYPEITSAIIIIENQEFRTENYKETAWEQSANIVLQGKKAGFLKVCYIEEKPNIDEGPFLNEERFLIDTIAEQLSRIIEYKHSEITLRETKKAAEHANLIKSEFLASVSHELRTPLNAVLGFAKVMSKDKNFPAHHGDHVTMIRQSGEILLALINQILDLSKIESGQMSVVETAFDLYSILDEINKMFSLLSKQKRLTLSIECGEDIPRNIVTDELKLRQVLINLIGNALKFTEKGNVSLVVKSIDNSSLSPDCPVLLYFVVKDTGPGISREEIDLLFNPFTQTEAGKKSHQGTGLGLSISQKFVELLGGEITVKSQLEKGTTFSFTIPVGKTSHSDENQTRTSITISNAGPDISQDTLKTEFKSLSRPLIHKLEEAATYCEVDDIHQFIQQVQTRHPNLAKELEHLVKEFDFDGILTLIKETK